MTPSHRTTEEGRRKGDACLDSPSRLEQKAVLKTENVQGVSWAEGDALCSEVEVSEQKRREPRADLEMSCPCQTS